MIDLSEIMREFWKGSHETDPAVAAKHLLSLIPYQDRDDVLLNLLGHEYTSFLSREGTQKNVRRPAAQNPSAQGSKVERSLDMRPFFVPSLKSAVHPGYVYFRDMTEARWLEWMDYRARRIEKMQASIIWASNVVARMTEYGVQVSGELPPEVKQEIFTLEGAPG